MCLIRSDKYFIRKIFCSKLYILQIVVFQVIIVTVTGFYFWKTETETEKFSNVENMFHWEARKKYMQFMVAM